MYIQWVWKGKRKTIQSRNDKLIATGAPSVPEKIDYVQNLTEILMSDDKAFSRKEKIQKAVAHVVEIRGIVLCTFG